MRAQPLIVSEEFLIGVGFGREYLGDFGWRYRACFRL